MTDDDILDVLPDASQAPKSEEAQEEETEPSWKEQIRELERKLKKQTHRLHNAEKTIKSQEELHRRNLDAQRDKILRDLQAKKLEAVSKGDVETVNKVDTEMRQAEQAHQQLAAQRSGDQHPEYVRFIEKNDWYDENRKMRLWANAYAQEIRQDNPNVSLREMFQMISEEARKEFPESFMNSAKQKPAAVEGTTAPASKTKDGTPGWESIPKDYRPVFEAMWKQGAWGQTSKRDAARKYAADLIQIGVIEE